MQSLADDALLDDWGRQFTGLDGIDQWNTTENIGAQTHFEFVGVEPGRDPDSLIVTLAITGSGYNGVGRCPSGSETGKSPSYGSPRPRSAAASARQA